MKRLKLLLGILILASAAWGVTLWRSHQFKLWLGRAGREELTRYVAEHPDQPQAVERLGALVLQAGENPQAETLLKHAVELSPADASIWVELSRSQSDDREAIRELEGYLKAYPDSASVMSETARRYLAVGDVASAAKLVAKATEVEPESADALRVAGDIEMLSGNAVKAEAMYRKSLKARDNAESRLALAHLWIPLQKYADIITICKPIINKGENSDVSAEQRTRALIYEAGARLYGPLSPSELADAQHELSEADRASTKLNPGERYLPPYFLGESLLRQGKPGDAIPYLERSVRDSPNFPGTLYSLSRAYRLAGDIPNAEKTMAAHIALSKRLTEMEAQSERAGH